MRKPQNQVVVRDYENRDFDQVTDLFKNVFKGRVGNDFLVDRLDEYFEWAYERNPDSQIIHTSRWVAEEGGQIVGFICGMPVAIKVGSQYLGAAWAQNVMVHPDHQGKGLGTMLLTLPQEEAPDLALALGMSEVSHKLLLRLGWYDVDADYMMRYVLRKRGVLWLLLDRIRRRDWMSALAAVYALVTVHGLHHGMRKMLSNDVSIKRVLSLDDRFDRLWEIAAETIPILVVRNREYLTWRYNRSLNHFAIFSAEDCTGRLLGYIALRERGQNGIIADFLVAPMDSRVQKKLLISAIDYFRAKNLDGILCLMPTGKAAATVLRQVGFLKTEQRLWLMFKPKSRDLSVAFLRDPQNWFVSMGDNDVAP